jgi:hypothetical protein
MATSGLVRSISEQITEKLRQSLLAGEFPSETPLSGNE